MNSNCKKKQKPKDKRKIKNVDAFKLNELLKKKFKIPLRKERIYHLKGNIKE